MHLCEHAAVVARPLVMRTREDWLHAEPEVCPTLAQPRSPLSQSGRTNVTCKQSASSSTCCRPGTWFGKPARISAAVCASHGWTNSGMDALKCAACNAVLSFTSSDTLHGHDADALVDTFLSNLSQKHEAYCLWHSHEPTRHDLIAFPAAQPAAVCEAFVGRIAELGQLDSLPHLGGAGMALLTDRCLNQLIALLEATAVPIAVRCAISLTSRHRGTCFAAL